MLIVGTVPVRGMPLVLGEAALEGYHLLVDGQRIPCTQGTGAMVSAALATTAYLGIDPPHALLVGDTGDGRGSREMYRYLIDRVAGLSPGVLALHYWLPIMSLTRALCTAIDRCQRRPFMIADAGSMYSAKAAGLAEAFDVFTPDATEVAFLADPEATHPAYIARHLFETDVSRAPELARAAYDNHGAAGLLVVKGSTDYIMRDGEVLATVGEPDVPALEAIGGTGDTITGLVTALVHAGLEPWEAAVIAARTNRMAGKYAAVTPATRVSEVIAQFPAVFRDHLCEWSGVCYVKGERSHGGG